MPRQLAIACRFAIPLGLGLYLEDVATDYSPTLLGVYRHTQVALGQEYVLSANDPKSTQSKVVSWGLELEDSETWY